MMNLKNGFCLWTMLLLLPSPGFGEVGLEFDCRNVGYGCNAGGSKIVSTEDPGGIAVAALGKTHFQGQWSHTSSRDLFIQDQRLLILKDRGVWLMEQETGLAMGHWSIPSPYTPVMAAWSPTEVGMVVAANYGEQGVLSQKLFFFDELGYPLGDQGINQQNRGWVRQVMVVDDLILVQFWKPVGNDEGLSSFHTARLEPQADPALEIDPVPFFSRPTRGLDSAFKHYQATSLDGSLFLAEELGRYVWQFNRHDGSLVLEQKVSLNLYLGGPSRVADHRQATIAAIPRITGFQATDQGFLLTYEAPDPEHTWFGGSKQGNTGRQLLVLSLNKKGQPVGQAHRLSGRLFAGMGEQAYLVLNQGQTATLLEERPLPGHEKNHSLVSY